MGPLEREAAQERGQRKLDALRRRAGLLRRRVVATAIVGFVLLWTVVFVQMATGNDPVLGAGTATRSGTEKNRAADLRRRTPETTAPPPSEESEESEAGEAAGAEAEQFEVEQREAEARELEELEAITTGQS